MNCIDRKVLLPRTINASHKCCKYNKLRAFHYRKRTKVRMHAMSLKILFFLACDKPIKTVTNFIRLIMHKRAKVISCRCQRVEQQINRRTKCVRSQHKLHQRIGMWRKETRQLKNAIYR